MTASVLVNGQATESLAVSDRGLSYGDGVFRTIEVQAGRPVAWQAHWQRLQHDCARLGLELESQAIFLSECDTLFESESAGVLKIIITRGQGGRGYTPPDQAAPTRILQRHSLPQKPDTLSIGVCDIRLGRNPALAGIKHLNRLEQVLARRECASKNLPEALLLDSDGWVISGSMSNLFLVQSGALLTPRLDQAGVIGATRQRLIAAAQTAGVRVFEKNVELQDCVAAQALLLSNSLLGVCSVSRLHTPQQTVDYTACELGAWCRDQIASVGHDQTNN